MITPVKRIARPSVASLFIEMKFGDQLLASGSAFVARGCHGFMLFTNRHNVTGRHQETGETLSNMGGVPDRLIVHHNRAGALGQWVQREELLFDERERPRWVEHPRLKEKADLVGLPLSSLVDVELIDYDLTKADAGLLVAPSDDVSVVGFPFGLRVEGGLAVWATGSVASEPEADFDGLPIFLIDCRTRRGQSGSAVIAYRSGGMLAKTDGSVSMSTGPVEQLMGIYSGRINAESDLGRVWKVSTIKEILATLGPPQNWSMNFNLTRLT